MSFKPCLFASPQRPSTASASRVTDNFEYTAPLRNYLRVAGFHQTHTHQPVHRFEPCSPSSGSTLCERQGEISFCQACGGLHRALWPPTSPLRLLANPACLESGWQILCKKRFPTAWPKCRPTGAGRRKLTWQEFAWCVGSHQ